MAEQTRVKINLSSGDIEVEGKQSFVEQQLKNLPDTILSLRGELKKTRTTVAKGPKKRKKRVSRKRAASKPTRAAAKKAAVKVPDSFDKLLSDASDKLSQNDKVLLSGFYHQAGSKKNAFTSSDALKLLKERNIKISNVSNSMAQLLKTKRVARTKKEGRLSYYKITNSGKDYLGQLTQSQ